MSIQELQALRHPRIVAFHKFYSEYHVFFALAAERFRVSFRVYETGDGRFFFEQSHFIRTPVQEAAHVLDAEKHPAPGVALASAVGSITTYYEEALDRGHEPCAAWFVHNDLY